VQYFKRKNTREILLILLGAIIGVLIGEIYDFLITSEEERLLQELNQEVKLILLSPSFPRQEKELWNDNPNKILFRPAVIDGTIYEKQNKYHFLMATITVGKQKKRGIANNFIINPNLVYDISYNIDGYILDTDDIYVDQGLFNLPYNTTKFEIKTDHFITCGTFSPEYNDFTCIVKDEKTNQYISFIYKRKDPDFGFNVVRILNSMYALDHVAQGKVRKGIPTWKW
jgi:hypothetical protein